MHGLIRKGKKLYVAVPVGSAKVSTASIVYVQVPAGQTLAQLIQ